MDNETREHSSVKEDEACERLSQMCLQLAHHSVTRLYPLYPDGTAGRSHNRSWRKYITAQMHKHKLKRRHAS